MCHFRFSQEAEAKAGVDEPEVSEGRHLQRTEETPDQGKE